MCGVESTTSACALSLADKNVPLQLHTRTQQCFPKKEPFRTTRYLLVCLYSREPYVERHIAVCVCAVSPPHTHCCYLDQKYETVVLPMHGTATPFHISTIKVHVAATLDSTDPQFCMSQHIVSCFVMYFFIFPRISVAVKKETMCISE